MANTMATFSLDVKAWSALAELARIKKMSKSEIVRELIHQEWRRYLLDETITVEEVPDNLNVAETD